MRTALIFGASGAVGGFFLPLLDGHYRLMPVSRLPRNGWRTGDLLDAAANWPITDIVISLGPLDAFATWLERQATAPQRVIALSSMSAESKRASPDPIERELAARLRAAEQRLLTAGKRHGCTCTIFRPTLIYGAGKDRSLAPIARAMRRWHLAPIPLGATGLRQPVHAADLAAACAAAIANPISYGKTYELGGGERLSFTSMLRRVRAAQPGFVLPLPVPLVALRVLAPLLRSFSTGALARLQEPLLADNGPAVRDLGYSPRDFRGADVLPSG